MNSDPIVIIDDDEDDCQVINEVIISLDIPNKIYFFSTSEAALQFLQSISTNIFLFFVMCICPVLTDLWYEKK